MKHHTSFVGCLELLRGGFGLSTEIAAARKVDLSQYMGPWRVLACTDNKLEREFVDAVETYALGPNGEINVHFEWRDKSFAAPIKTHDFTGRVVKDGSNARWKMRLFPLFTASYIIVKVSPDYSRAAIAHPSRKFGWVLARNRTLPESEFQELLAALGQQGYDTSSFVRIPQVHDGTDLHIRTPVGR